MVRVPGGPPINDKLIAIAILVIVPAAWTAAAEQNPGAWLIFSTGDTFESGGVPSRWGYAFDAQARYFDFGSDVSQYLLRPSLVYRLRDELVGSLGYARFRARGRSGNTVDEDRFWQQLEWTAPVQGVSTLKLRLRLEQRLLDVGDDTGIVARIQARLVRPLGSDTGRQLVVGIEPFFDLTDTDWGASSGLSQNRVYAGIAQRLGESLTLEYGYMNQYFFRDSAEDISNHLLILHARVRF